MDLEVEFSDSSTEEFRSFGKNEMEDDTERKGNKEVNMCSRSGRVRKMRYSDFSQMDDDEDDEYEEYDGYEEEDDDGNDDYDDNSDYEAMWGKNTRANNKKRPNVETKTRSVRASRKIIDYSNFDGPISSDSFSEYDNEDREVKKKKGANRERAYSKVTRDMTKYTKYGSKESYLNEDSVDNTELDSNGVQENIRNIERVLESRNSKENADIIEYKIKWMGYSHLHNTWETVESLIKERVGGMRRLENYQKKMTEIQNRRRFMTEDEIEQEEITFEIQKQLDMDALVPEKIVDIYEEKEAEYSSDDIKKEALVQQQNHSSEESSGNLKTHIYYLVKWLSCPYDQCTWESHETLLEHNFLSYIESFQSRMNIIFKYDKQCNYEMRSLALTSFEPYSSTPFYMGVKISEMNRIKDFGESNKEESILKDGGLRDYQVYGLNWIISRFKNNINVLLADEMGLGKTVQTISVVGHCIYMEKVIAPFLVVVPQSTCDNWITEFKKWLPDLNVVLYHGNAYARELIRTYELKMIDMITNNKYQEECVYSSNKKVFNGRRYRFDVLITTPSILNSQVDCEYLRQIKWYMMIVDEAHQLKNRESKRFKELHDFNTKYRLLLSGTPLHNNLEELWSLLHFLNPNNFERCDEFRARYPDIENPNIISLDKQRQLEELQQELQEYVLRRVKKDVEKSLPNKIERILRVELSPQQTEIYKSILTRNYEVLSRNTGGTKTSLQNICMELKKVCNHPFLIHRPELDPDRGISIASIQHQLIYGCGKLCLLDKLLYRLKEKGSRVLIFSQMVMMLNIISEFLVVKGYKYQRLDGTMGKELRKKAMDHFNSPNSDDFCFLLSTKAGGLGINLTTADTVIIYDSDWNPQNDLQAEARAHRIGQKKQVQIYRLVTKDSIEENILERAKTKMVLDTLVVQGLNNIGSSIRYNDETSVDSFKKATSIVSMANKALCFNNNKTIGSNSTFFSKDELAKILKFGAKKLWDKNNENGIEFETKDDNKNKPGSLNYGVDEDKDRRFASNIDLDKVLADAEENTHDVQGLADGLLRSFSNISDFRYEAPPPILDSNTGVLISLVKDKKDEIDFDNKEFWEKTIPVEERRVYDDNNVIVNGPRKSAMRDGFTKCKENYHSSNNSKNNVDNKSTTTTVVKNENNTDLNDCYDDIKEFKAKEKVCKSKKSDKGRKDENDLNRQVINTDSITNENNNNNVNYPLPSFIKLENKNDFEDLMYKITGFEYKYGDLDERFPDEISNIYKTISQGKKILKNGKPAKSDARLLNPKKRFKVFRSMLKYGDPYKRLDDIVSDLRFKKNIKKDVILNEAQIIISLCYENFKNGSSDNDLCVDYNDYHCGKMSENYLDSDKNKRNLILIGNNKANPSELLERIKMLSALDKLMKECNPGVDKPWKLSTGPLSCPDRFCDVKEEDVDEDVDEEEDIDEDVDEEEVKEEQEKVEEQVKEMKEKGKVVENINTKKVMQTKENKNIRESEHNHIEQTNCNNEYNGGDNSCEKLDYLKCELPPQLTKSLRMPSWGIPWTLETDINLLKGIYIYGFSNWTLISMDENLSLSCIRNIKFDKLKQRTLRMLKYLHSFMIIGKTERKKRKVTNNTIKDNDTNNNTVTNISPCSFNTELLEHEQENSISIEPTSKKSNKRKKVEIKNQLQTNDHKQEDTDGSQSLKKQNCGSSSTLLEHSIDKRKQEDNHNADEQQVNNKKNLPEFLTECALMDEKEIKKQVKIFFDNSNIKNQIIEIKKLFKPENDISDTDIVTNLKLHLPSVGDEINEILKMASNDLTRKKVHSFLWSYVAKCTVFQPCDIEKIYLGWKGVTNIGKK